MNREIKFRTFDGTDFMSKPFTLRDIMLGNVQFTGDCPIMQFTGLKDSNGKEIYEGDICICDKGLYEECAEGEFKFIVKFVDGDFWPWCEDLTADQCVVVGNIYETPELKP